MVFVNYIYEFLVYEICSLVNWVFGYFVKNVILKSFESKEMIV